MTNIEFILTNEKINPILASTTTGQIFGDDCKPVPAKNFISEEYKNLPNTLYNDLRNLTAKKCVPFLDAMTSGYIIPFYQDYLLTVNPEKGGLEVTTKLNQMEFHSHDQLPANYQEAKKPVGKFNNKWIVRTPPGYSCLFVHPMNQPKTVFEIVSGVVDTDTYEPSIFFPFYWRGKDIDPSAGHLQVHIKKGDPMVQVIPFKRERWKSWAGEKKSYKKNINVLGRIVDIYRKYYWRKKTYE